MGNNIRVGNQALDVLTKFFSELPKAYSDLQRWKLEKQYEREIYKNSYTDDGLKKVQKGYLKLLQSRARAYKKEIADWWQQRKAEDDYFKKPNKKTNGKADDN